MNIDVSLVEEMILNYAALPPEFDEWRRYRIEYLSDERAYQFHEETIYLPPGFDAYKLENYLNRGIRKNRKGAR